MRDKFTPDEDHKTACDELVKTLEKLGDNHHDGIALEAHIFVTRVVIRMFLPALKKNGIDPHAENWRLALLKYIRAEHVKKDFWPYKQYMADLNEGKEQPLEEFWEKWREAGFPDLEPGEDEYDDDYEDSDEDEGQAKDENEDEHKNKNEDQDKDKDK